MPKTVGGNLSVDDNSGF